MAELLNKTYDPKDIEDRIYEKWEKNGYFHAKPDESKTPFTIVMPPPNITGQLHMGHALDNTLQDILIRYKRMKGFNALWQPGTDHASIATEVKVIESLKEKGINKEDLTREEFLEKCFEWKEEYGGRIVKQLKKMGSSADWERERFTMDEGCNDAVETVFKNLYEKGLIYKGKRIINWCPVCKTSISDAEVIHEDQKGHFWHINYPVSGEEGRFVEIATTRPETMLGDTALAVNPKDERYKDLIGKKVILPLVNKEIPIVSDEYVDMEFGTGVVKITPAHDPNDFEVGKRHDLPVINILNDDATINENGGKYAGLDRYEAREKIVSDLKDLGLLVKVKEHEHAVGTHDRCHTTVEPMVKPQWFVAMEELRKPAIKAIETGELKFVPERFDKTYLHWLNNIRDWCISRQLYWGHRIPAWYCDSCGEVMVEKTKNAPKICVKCGSTHLTQDPDTLDTWFSSALWPFSTLGWPKETEELKYFYPTDVLVTGYDIIFFWVVRMVFSGYEHTGRSPFNTVFIHGLVRDCEGRKMSKSLGNGIDPLEIIDKYGADALRLTLVTGNAPGNDMRFYYERVEASRNFANKVWNASRFIMMNLNGEDIKKPDKADLKTEDKYIISRINSVSKEVSYNMDRFELGIAVQKIYDFIWDEFCDWYIEMVKPRMQGDDRESKNAALYTLRSVLNSALKLLHPFMPFITEEIFCTLNTDEDTIMNKDYPVFNEEDSDSSSERKIGRAIELVRAVRNVRTDMNVKNNKKAKLFITSENDEVLIDLKDCEMSFIHLAGGSKIHYINTKKEKADEDLIEKSASAVINDAVIYLPLSELIDPAKEKERLSKEKERLLKEIERSKNMLGNEKFLSKAPKEKVDEEKQKYEKYEGMLKDVEDRLNTL